MRTLSRTQTWTLKKNDFLTVYNCEVLLYGYKDITKTEHGLISSCTAIQNQNKLFSAIA